MPNQIILTILTAMMHLLGIKVQQNEDQALKDIKQELSHDILYKLSKIDQKAITIETIKKVRKLIQFITDEDVKNASSAISGIYNWIVGICEYKEIQHQQDNKGQNKQEEKELHGPHNASKELLTKAQIFEIKSMKHPPPIIFNLLQSMVYLLGEGEKTHKNLQLELHQDLLERFIVLDPLQVKLEDVHKVRQLLLNINLEQIKQVSRASSSIFKLVCRVCDIREEHEKKV